jgi:acetyl-CoA carboxylase carboxyl transferase subunit alpha
MKITAQDLKELEIIDEIVNEPVGGAHRARDAAIEATGEALARALQALANMGPEEIRQHRREKFLAIGKQL